jgi:tetratricopeptide (TPR) repeat protein
VTDQDRYAGLRAALARNYRIEEVLRETPAGAAYLARDLALDRRVLIKAVDPEWAGEGVAAEFAREARTLAGLSDPGIPAIHHADSFGAFRFVVVESPEGPTLEERLREGPLPAGEVLRLGVQLLGALETAHAAGIAHSAVSARTVMVAPGRYLLDGFGSALPSSGEAELEDLRAVGRLLRAAAGGTLPGPLREAVERALDTDRRRPGAAAFRQALEALERRPSRPRLRGGAAAAAVLSIGLLYGAVASRGPGPPGPAPRELAILPLEVDGGQALDPLGSDLAYMIQLGLAEVPGLELTPRGQVDRWWEAQAGEEAVDGFSAAGALRANWVAHGAVDRRPNGVLRIRLSLYDSSGTARALPEVRGPAADLASLSDSLGLTILRVVAPRGNVQYDPSGGFAGVPLPALKAFLRGEAAFAQDAWAAAQRHYEIALGIDSTFALADWRLANVRRWRRLAQGAALTEVYRRHASRLRARDRLLIEAMLESDLEVRFARLDSAVRRLPGDAHARLLYGDELFHLGPLAGRQVDEALPVMAAAVARDSSLAPAYDHLVLGHVRAGRRREARGTLVLRQRLGRGDRRDDLDLLPFLDLVYDERFVPWRAWARYRLIAWRKDPRQIERIERVARFGTPWLDLPGTQLRYSDLLLRIAPADAETQVTAREGKALALVALGRLDQAFAEIDTVAALLDSPEARLHQAEWRTVLSALGLPGVDTEPWELRLAAMAEDSALRDRAAWALALLVAGDSARARRWSERITPGSPLRVLSDARLAAAGGDLPAALAMTDSIRPRLEPGRAPDPFAGAALHLLRGDWLSASGEPARAEREWLWYEATEVEGWPTGLAGPGEVGAALGTFARLKRARALFALGTASDSLVACGHLSRLRVLWAEAEPAFRERASQAATLAESCRA